MKKALSLLLSILMVFTVFAVAVPFVYAEDELPPVIKAFTNPAEAFYPQKGEITQVVFADLDNVSAPDDSMEVGRDEGKSVKAWIVNQDDVKILYIAGKGGVTLNPYSASLFEGFNKVESISFSGVVNTSIVTSMEKMFKNCSSLKDIDLKDFDTSNVINFNEMFMDCTSLGSSLDLSSLEINKATSMARMLRGCTGLEEVRLDNWYFGPDLADMNELFSGCSKLKTVYIYDVGYHARSKPTQNAVYYAVPSGLTFHDNNNIGTDAELWTRFFDDASGAVLVFDYPEQYQIVVNPEKMLMIKGQTKTVSYKILPRPENSSVKIVSSDKNVVTVDDAGNIYAVSLGKATVTIFNTTVDNGVAKVSNGVCEVEVVAPQENDVYDITFVKPEGVEYFQVSSDGGESYIPVHGGTFRYVKDTKLIVKTYGNAIAYVFQVDGRDVESQYDNRLDLTVDKNKTVTVRVINAPTGEETVSFFERIIQWFRDLFDKLFGWMK